MQNDPKWQFITATLRFRKVDVCELSGTPIPFGELVVMGSVLQSQQADEGALDTAGLCKQLCVSKPAVSQILSSLERKGCIVREIDPSDRRRIAVSPTEKGCQMLQRSQACYDDALDTLLARLSREELATLTHLMERLSDIYEELKNDPAQCTQNKPTEEEK